MKQKYEKLTPIEHVLKRPGMYIGDINTNLQKIHIAETCDGNVKLTENIVDYNAGFFKLFDEIVTNAADHSIRTNKVKYIKITVNSDHIIVENDGPGLPVEINKEHKLYVPEMVFGHLHSGSNFDDDSERTWGGTNGVGATLANIYSKKFIVETADGKKKYVQEFTDNLSKIHKPTITKLKKNYTKITYYPDFGKFTLDEITEDMSNILKKRAIDIAVYCSKVKVYYNDELLPIKNFKDYMSMYLGDNEIFYEKLNDGWELGIASSLNDDFQQVSMVNGIFTSQGGTHVNYITNQIIKGVTDILEKKHKNIKIKANDIKNKLFIFLTSQVINPTFDTQTKENLTTRLTQKHVGGVVVSDKIIKSLVQSEIVEDILNYIRLREKSELLKLNKGKKSKIKIKKLDDANMAGTSQSDKCTLFITEGDSALGTCITGFASTGRDYYGAFPLKGKPLNVRDTTLSKIKDNEEIKNIITALGLEFGKKYTNTNELRYGKIAIMSDADCDGNHIKGLIINLFETFWKELLDLDFIYEFVTPIVKIEKGKISKFFYKISDYDSWKKKNDKGWFVTYYKGLGTIEAHEAKGFFKNINKHLIKIHYDDVKGESEEIIDLVFRKNRANDRKSWLLNYKADNVVDKFTETTTYKSFFNKEFIEFSMADNIRSIPSLVDGLKPSQRKVLYTMFKNNYKNKTKVSNLTGAVVEKSSYHHGPAALESTIISMAQNIIGTNNLNLLMPLGNFGTRLKGGKDAASSRYIFTKLSDVTRYIYNENDDPILNYLKDDGFEIEPNFYVPIIPVCLVNGADGVGTGWSTSLPNYDVCDIIEYLVNKIKNKPLPTLHPKYNNFKGKIKYDDGNDRYMSIGKIKKMNMSTLKITELPIGVWNDKYYDVLDKLMDDKIIKDYSKYDTDINVDIVINISRDTLKSIEKDDKLLEVFKLKNYISMTNINLFNESGQIQKYKNVDDIMTDFYDVRLRYYDVRKKYILNKLDVEKEILINKMKFINAILKSNLTIQNKKRKDIEDKLIEMGLIKIDNSYNYLFNMSLLSLTNEKLNELKNNYNFKKTEIELLLNTTEKKMWLKDLSALYKKIK